ncbi:hypothetical protein B0H21DRAFT_823926 [Amylocystis lapponica]|nr:hypothetical protein B0H21DRAFT_823926 [Amylocystis lapponica]
MEDPVREIDQVVLLITAAVNPEIQNAAVARYYAPDAAFRHPSAPSTPAPAPAAVLAVLHWYRVLSPHIAISVRRVTYNPDTRELFLDILQTFHIRWSPLQPSPPGTSPVSLPHPLTPHQPPHPPHPPPGPRLHPPRLLIAEHEDFYHPDDFIALLVPPLVPLVRASLRSAPSRVPCSPAQPQRSHGEGGRGVALQPAGEPLPPDAHPSKKND